MADSPRTSFKHLLSITLNSPGFPGEIRNFDGSYQQNQGGGDSRLLLFFRLGRDFPYGRDEESRRAGQGTITAVGQDQFTPELAVLHLNESDSPSLGLVAGKGSADKGHAEVGGHETLDHSDARQFHPDLYIGVLAAKQTIQQPARVTGFGKKQRVFQDFADGNNLVLGQGILGTHHQHQLVAEHGLDFQTRRLHGKGHDANVNRAVFQLLDNLVGKVAVDADLDAGIEAAIFGENLGQYIKAGGLVGPNR